jgi:hypothetical protein
MESVSDWITGRPQSNSTEDRPIPLPYEITFDSEIDLSSLSGAKSFVEVLHMLKITYGQNSALYRTWYNIIILNFNISSSILDRILGMMDTKTIRRETFSRLGANSTDINENLSEQSFYYMMKKSIESGKYTAETARNSFQYVYPALKVIFDDNLLDDNNNIINFSSDRDIPVLRLRFRYKYE